MYSVNNTQLHNDTLGWRLLRSSVPEPNLTSRVTNIVRNGRDGVGNYPIHREQTTMQFTIETGFDNLETLLALFSQPSLEITKKDLPKTSAFGYLLSSTVEAAYHAKDKIIYSFLVEIPQGMWRSSSEVTEWLLPTGTSTPFNVLSGISAPVQDGKVQFRGPLQKPVLTDSSGSFISIDGTVAAGEYVRYEMDLGRAWLTSTNSWVGGTEISGQIDFGGPRSIFEITPNFTNPVARVGKITLSQQSFDAGAGIRIQARNGFLAK